MVQTEVAQSEVARELPQSEARQKSWHILLWPLIAGGIYIRFQAALEFSPIYALFSDPGRHWKFALAPLLNDPLSAMDAPLYQLWLTVVAKLTLGDPLALSIYAGTMSVLTCYIWYRAMREFLPSRTLAMVGWALLLWLPSWIGIFSYFMTETLVLPMLGVALWFTFRSMRLRTLESFVWCVVFWTLTGLARAFAIPLAVVSLCYLLYRDQHRTKKLLIAAVIVICGSLPSAYRTYQILRVWSPFGYTMMNQIYFESGARDIHIHLTKDGGTVGWMYGFASPSMSTRPLRPLSEWTSSRTGIFDFNINIDQGNRDWAASFRRSWGGIGLHARMWWENTIYTTFGESWPDNNPKHFWEHLAINLRWMWAPLLLFVLAGNLAYIIKSRSLPLLLALSMTAILACYFVPATPTEGRYRKQIEGFLIVNALWLVSAGPNPSSRRSPKAG